MYFFLENTVLFRSLFFIFLIAVPVINLFSDEFNSMYVLIVIFLGIGYSSKAKWFLILMSFFVVSLRSAIISDFEHPSAFIMRLLVYLVVTFISAEVTNQYLLQKQNKTELIMALSKLLDSRDTYTANHSENVANYSLMIAKEMGLSKAQAKAIYIGGLLHDTGKIGVPESILLKPTALTDDEYEIIKQHPLLGFESLKHISYIKDSGVLDMILYHHERYDGSGYPQGLKGTEIPLAARIMAIADSFDAMTSRRGYNDVLDVHYAINEISKNKGTQFDPEIADVFLNILKSEVDYSQAIGNKQAKINIKIP